MNGAFLLPCRVLHLAFHSSNKFTECSGKPLLILDATIYVKCSFQNVSYQTYWPEAGQLMYSLESDDTNFSWAFLSDFLGYPLKIENTTNIDNKIPDSNKT